MDSKTEELKPVLRIRIHMFLGLPDPDPLVRGTDPGILLSSSKISKKNLDSYCFVTSLCLFVFEKGCKYNSVVEPEPEPEP
jgi:hypothetical protein